MLSAMIELFPSREVMLTIGTVSVHWYGLMYLLGFICGWFMLPHLAKLRSIPMTRDRIDTIVFYVALGVIFGGRLGYVLFWEPKRFLADPLDIFRVWEGGMSSHGGFLAVLLLIIYFCHRSKINFWALADVIVVPIALGLMFGRFGNFINQELYGTVTTLPWGMQFDGVEGLRHPTQFYAMIKDATIALVCFLYLKATPHAKPGRSMALFFMLYGVFRFIVEYFRDQTGYPMHYWGSITLTQGQMLTIPIVLIGVFLWFYRSPRRA